MPSTKDAEELRLATEAQFAVRRSRRRQYLASEVAAAREEGFGMEPDPIAELYDDATGLPRCART